MVHMLCSHQQRRVLKAHLGLFPSSSTYVCKVLFTRTFTRRFDIPVVSLKWLVTTYNTGYGIVKMTYLYITDNRDICIFKVPKQFWGRRTAVAWVRIWWGRYNHEQNKKCFLLLWKNVAAYVLLLWCCSCKFRSRRVGSKTIMYIVVFEILHTNTYPSHICDKHICITHICDKHICITHICVKHICITHICVKHICRTHIQMR
jgi:hypothetical protein